MNNHLQQRSMNTGVSYQGLQSKKKLQPITQAQQQQQFMMQGGNQQQSSSQQNQQGYASQGSQNSFSQIQGINSAQSPQAPQSQNSTPYLSNYYLGSSTNQNYQGNQLQHQILQQNQNTNKSLNSSSSPKQFFGQQSTTYANSNSYLDNSSSIQKQKMNTSLNQNQSHIQQQQQQITNQQMYQYGQPIQTSQNNQGISSNQQASNSQLQQVSQVQSNHQMNDVLYSPNSQMKKNKLFIDTNNNFYYSQQNMMQMSNLKLSGNLSTQSSQSSASSKGIPVGRKSQKSQRSPISKPQQTSSNFINQSGLLSLSNNSPQKSSALSYLNNSGLLSNSNNGNGSFNLNSSLNSNTSQNMTAPYSDEQRLIKKTQHFVRGLTSLSGTWNGNNQEEIEDLNESVIEMMKEFNLYDQSQKGIIPDADPTKFSVKRNGIVSCYSAKTHQGLVRNYNEDRVSIILNIMKPQNRQNDEQWPKCSFFGVYDGHGGINCADFLRDHLHQYVIKDPNFPWNPKEALKNGFEQAELQFLKQAQSQINKLGGQVDRSGSCAVVVLIVGDTCYVANVGDSRAVMSSDGGKNVSALTRDHKPMDEVENQRIHDNGGKVYQTKIQSIAASNNKNEEPQTIVGPYRVLPGRLSVTRTFGDIEAKFPRYGGNPKVVVATPEIKSFKIQPNHDFIILGCDGIYDKITSQEIGQIVWDTSKNESLGESIHEFAGKSAENIMKLSVARKTLDNITVVMIGFDNLDRILFDKAPTPQEVSPNLQGISSINDQIQSPSNTLSQTQVSSQNTIISPSNSSQTITISSKNQKLLQSISQSASPQQVQYGLPSKNTGLSQNLNDKQKLTQQSLSNFEKQNKTSSYLGLTNTYLNQGVQSSLTEKESNQENGESKLAQSTYSLGSSSRIQLNNSKRKTSDNSHDDIPSLKQSQLMNKTGNLQRPKIGTESLQQTNQISPLYSSQQFSSNNPSHSSLNQSKTLASITQSASDAKLRSGLIKTLSTK